MCYGNNMMVNIEILYNFLKIIRVLNDSLCDKIVVKFYKNYIYMFIIKTGIWLYYRVLCKNFYYSNILMSFDSMILYNVIIDLIRSVSIINVFVFDNLVIFYSGNFKFIVNNKYCFELLLYSKYKIYKYIIINMYRFIGVFRSMFELIKISGCCYDIKLDIKCTLCTVNISDYDRYIIYSFDCYSNFNGCFTIPYKILKLINYIVGMILVKHVLFILLHQCVGVYLNDYMVFFKCNGFSNNGKILNGNEVKICVVNRQIFCKCIIISKNLSTKYNSIVNIRIYNNKVCFYYNTVRCCEINDIIILNDMMEVDVMFFVNISYLYFFFKCKLFENINIYAYNDRSFCCKTSNYYGFNVSYYFF